MPRDTFLRPEGEQGMTEAGELTDFIRDIIKDDIAKGKNEGRVSYTIPSGTEWLFAYWPC